ncbi:MAG: hypothetical protein IRZ02_05330 [Acidothermus sp.]|nr:hypothetical protein [Acidothermus sp.]MCL6538882.1 hypothetical protein [Acidothermus sp.]
MLYALRFPFSLVVLAVGYVLAVGVRGVVQRALSGAPRLRPARRTRPRLLPLARFVDPYGALCAVLGGVGWGASPDDVPVPLARGRTASRAVAAFVAGPVVLFGLGTAALVGYDRLTQVRPVGSGLVINTVRGDMLAVDHFHYHVGYGATALYLLGVEFLAMALLAVVPLPPMDGGRLLFALAPKTIGWQRARYRLEDDNWGILIMLILSLPIFGEPIIIAIIDAILGPFITAVT